MLVAGGVDHPGFIPGWGTPVTSLTSAELYDATHGTWSHTAGLKTPRLGHTATLLTNGNVLVVGGSWLDPDTAELFERNASPANVDSNLTGAWYDPSQKGHGLFIQGLSDNRFLAWWFTFNPEGTEQVASAAWALTAATAPRSPRSTRPPAVAGFPISIRLRL